MKLTGIRSPLGPRVSTFFSLPPPNDLAGFSSAPFQFLQLQFHFQAFNYVTMRNLITGRRDI